MIRRVSEGLILLSVALSLSIFLGFILPGTFPTSIRVIDLVTLLEALNTMFILHAIIWITVLLTIHGNKRVGHIADKLRDYSGYQFLFYFFYLMTITFIPAIFNFDRNTRFFFLWIPFIFLYLLILAIPLQMKPEKDVEKAVKNALLQFPLYPVIFIVLALFGFFLGTDLQLNIVLFIALIIPSLMEYNLLRQFTKWKFQAKMKEEDVESEHHMLYPKKIEETPAD